MLSECRVFCADDATSNMHLAMRLVLYSIHWSSLPYGTYSLVWLSRLPLAL
jgi:hypothetical protein